MKTQMIRLLDVFVIGPLMIYTGLRTNKPLLRNSMFVLGLATILYNGNNYIKYK